MARKRKTQMELPVATLLDTGAQVDGEALATGPEQTAPTRWRVAQTTKVSLFGQLTTLQAGDVVSVASYGVVGMLRIAEQVALEPVE